MCGQDTPGLKAHPSFQHLASTPSLIVLQAFGELQYWFPHPKFEYLDLTRVGISAVTIHWLPKKTNSNATRCLCSWSSEWDSGGGFSICLGHVLMYPRTNCLSCNWMEPIEPLSPCQKLHPELSDSPGLSKVNGKNTTGCYNTMCRFALEFTCNWTKSLVHAPKDGTALMLVLQWYFARKNWCHQQARVSSMTCLAMPAKVYMITNVNIASMEVFVDLTLNAEKICILILFALTLNSAKIFLLISDWTWRVAAKPIEPANWSMWKLKLTVLTCLESNWGSCNMQSWKLRGARTDFCTSLVVRC